LCLALLYKLPLTRFQVRGCARTWVGWWKHVVARSRRCVPIVVEDEQREWSRGRSHNSCKWLWISTRVEDGDCLTYVMYLGVLCWVASRIQSTMSCHPHTIFISPSHRVLPVSYSQTLIHPLKFPLFYPS
jgi:hypothetical protein